MVAGQIVATRAVDTPRPHTIETTFEPAFVDLVHLLRDDIGKVREA